MRIRLVEKRYLKQHLAEKARRGLATTWSSLATPPLSLISPLKEKSLFTAHHSLFRALQAGSQIPSTDTTLWDVTRADFNCPQSPFPEILWAFQEMCLFGLPPSVIISTLIAPPLETGPWLSTSLSAAPAHSLPISSFLWDISRWQQFHGHLKPNTANLQPSNPLPDC